MTRTLLGPGSGDRAGSTLSLTATNQKHPALRPTDQHLHCGPCQHTTFRDQTLNGGYAGCRECHLKPDLLLIYVQTGDELRLIRLDSHSELFA